MTKEEKSILKLFCYRAKRLLECNFLKGPNLIKFLKGDEPDEEQIESLLIRYRFFYLEGEDTNFFKICNILWKNAENEVQRESIRSIRKMYRKILNNDVGSLFSDKIKSNLPPKYNIDLWFNAYYFHSDEEKRKQLAQLYNEYGSILQFVLVRAIWGLSDAINQLYEFLIESFNINN